MLAYTKTHDVYPQNIRAECLELVTSAFETFKIQPNCLSGLLNTEKFRDYAPQVPDCDKQFLATLIKQSFPQKTDTEAQELAGRLFRGEPITTSLLLTSTEKGEIKLANEFTAIGWGAGSVLTGTLYVAYLAHEYDKYCTSWEETPEEQKATMIKKHFRASFGNVFYSSKKQTCPISYDLHR